MGGELPSQVAVRLGPGSGVTGPGKRRWPHSPTLRGLALRHITGSHAHQATTRPGTTRGLACEWLERSADAHQPIPYSTLRIEG